jgi:hypothetical protein
MLKVPNYAWQRLVDRFWGKVDRGDPGACWLWKGRTHKDTGRGMFEARDDPKSGQRTTTAHRFAYQVTHGLTVQEMRDRPVRHTCGNHTCCNPDHLVMGEPKGHWFKGRLTDEQVQLIRAMAHAGRLQKDIADDPQFGGLTRAQVSQIVSRKTYRDVPDVEVRVEPRDQDRPRTAPLVDPGATPEELMAAELAGAGEGEDFEIEFRDEGGWE